MTKSQVQYFMAVAREKSISKASEQLFVSQPAVSKQITLLEDELGVKLFSRKSHGLEITSAGIAFEHLFEQFETMFNETLQNAKNESGLIGGTYRLGFTDGWSIPPLYMDLFSSIASDFPSLDFDLVSCSVDQIYYKLKHGDVDHVITIENLFKEYEDIRVDHLTDVNAVLLFSENNIMAGKHNLRLSDFSDCPFYVATPSEFRYGVYDILSACASAGFAPYIEHVSSVSVIYNKIHTGNGVFLTSDWIMAKDNPRFNYLNLDYKISLGLVSLKEHESRVSNIIKKKILDFVFF